MPGKKKTNLVQSDKHVSDIVTCDETWIYSCKPEIKQQSTVCEFPDDSKSTKVIRATKREKKGLLHFSVNLAILQLLFWMIAKYSMLFGYTKI